MNLNYNDINISITNAKDIKQVSDSTVFLKDLKLVKTKGKISKKKIVTKAKNRKRSYKLVYYIINQNVTILNYTNPHTSLKEAEKFAKSIINEFNNILYIIPVKIPITGDKFCTRIALQANDVLYGLIEG
ncbi:MAG TPA: hypothetical protein PKD00_00215 [Burkholderiales bacterium]|nr:hypothetical protein [Burkholderiales bacterium]